jgi:Tfp pilus assembly protein FimT
MSLTGMTPSRKGERAAGQPARRPLARHSRRAHTLAELMLVLAILVLFAGIAMPKIATALMRSRLDGAFTAIRSDLVYARDRSVGTGLRHQFVLDPSSNEVGVQAYHPEEQLGTTGGASAGANSTTQSDVPLKDHLPSDIRVATWTIQPLGSDPSQPGTQFNTQGSVTPLVFYPEGNGDSATLVLEDQSGNRRGLQVIGFTGEIRELTPDEMK